MMHCGIYASGVHKCWFVSQQVWQNFFNTFCFYSSQIQPASEQGLLALSAIGLLASDTRLAALALSELVKVGQGGTFTFFLIPVYLLRKNTFIPLKVEIIAS